MTTTEHSDPRPAPAPTPMFSVAPRVATPPSAPASDLASPEPQFPPYTPPGAATPPPYEAPSTFEPSADLPVPVAAATAGVALARPNDGLPIVLDPYAVASRSVLVLIGSIEPAKHIARTAIEMSIEHDSSAAMDVVIPRAIDLVLRRAAHLVSIGAGPKVVDHYTERLELWRRLACRTGLEPAAIVLTLAPFPIPTVASMLRVPLFEVEACIDDWYAGIDPDELSPRSLAPVVEQTVDLREHIPAPPPMPPTGPHTERRHGWPRWRVRQA